MVLKLRARAAPKLRYGYALLSITWPCVETVSDESDLPHIFSAAYT